MEYNGIKVIKTVRFDYTFYNKKRKFEIVRCICSCGKEFETRLIALKSGNTKSCGCIRSMRARTSALERNTKHGLRWHRLYKTRSGMHQRCKHKNHFGYKYYGGRGISVCKERESIENFINDMYPTFKEGLTLDRIDNNGDYCKENCRRATIEEQANNKRPKAKKP